MKKYIKFLLSILFTIGILLLIFSRIELNDFVNNLRNIDLFWFLISLLLFIPVLLLLSERWRLLMSKSYGLTLVSSLKQILMGCTFNVFTPSKMGDLAKAVYLKRKANVPLKLSMGAVLFEKYLDFLTVCLFSFFGLLFFGEFTGFYFFIFILITLFIMSAFLIYIVGFNKLTFFFGLNKIKFIGNALSETSLYLDRIRRNKFLLFKIFFATLLSWVFQFFQIYIFFLMFDIKISFLVVLAFVPIAILIGLIPITFAGIGTRDSAMLVLFSSYLPEHLILSVSFFLTFRYLVPALFGVFFIKDLIRKRH